MGKAIHGESVGVLLVILHAYLPLQLRDGSTSSSKRQHAGVPPPRTPGGRLPGGACIPPSLEGWKYKVLLAGKYLNVIRECGIELQASQHQVNEQQQLSMDDQK